MSNYSHRIREILFKKGLTIKDFCKKLGLKSPNTIQLILRENRTPSPKTMKRILDAFPDIDPDWLIYGDKQEIHEETQELTQTAKQVKKMLLDGREYWDKYEEKHEASLMKRFDDDRRYYDKEREKMNDEKLDRIMDRFNEMQKGLELYAASGTSIITDMIKKFVEENSRLTNIAIEKILKMEEDLDDIKFATNARNKLREAKRKKENKFKPK